jgi:hypothetical protein
MVRLEMKRVDVDTKGGYERGGDGKRDRTVSAGSRGTTQVQRQGNEEERKGRGRGRGREGGSKRSKV